MLYLHLVNHKFLPQVINFEQIYYICLINLRNMLQIFNKLQKIPVCFARSIISALIYALNNNCLLLSSILLPYLMEGEYLRADGQVSSFSVLKRGN